MLANLLRRPAPKPATTTVERDSGYGRFAYNGIQYLFSGGNVAELEALEAMENPIVAAAVHARMLVFSEIRFAWQRYQGGRPAGLFGDQSLAVLEQPWPHASTGHLLARMELDASLFGNSYWRRVGDQLVRLDPSRVKILSGDVADNVTGNAYGKRLLGYVVLDSNGRDAAMFEPAEIAHYAPLPDAEHPFRGRSWLSSVLDDVEADDEMTDYKAAFLDNAATPNLIVKFDASVSEENFKAFKAQMEAGHAGADNAFRTLYLGGGADVKAVGSNFEQLSIKSVQGAGETRIAAAAGVPAPILGISEGLAGSALNAGNYGASRRRFADGTIRPLWRFACAALQTVVPPPTSGVRLWFDERDVSFLQEDVKDAADIRARDAATIRQLVDGGFDPDSAVEAVTSNDMGVLRHTGLISVQLLPPGTTGTPAA